MNIFLFGLSTKSDDLKHIILDTWMIDNKKRVPDWQSTCSRHPYQPRSIIRGQVFVAPLPASRGALFLTIPICSPSGKHTVTHEDMGWGSLGRPSFPSLQFPLLCSQTSWLQMFVTHPNNCFFQNWLSVHFSWDFNSYEFFFYFFNVFDLFNLMKWIFEIFLIMRNWWCCKKK